MPKGPTISTLLRLGSKRKGLYQAKDRGGFTRPDRRKLRNKKGKTYAARTC